MGCCLPRDRLLQPADDSPPQTIGGSTADPPQVAGPVQFVPSPVRRLAVAVDSKHLSATLSWERPENCIYAEDVRRYHIHFAAMVYSRINSDFQVNYGTMMSMLDAQMTTGSVEVLGTSTQVTIERSDGLQPMLEYTFEVRAESQDGRLGVETKVTTYLDWHCRLPNCYMSRIRLDSRPYVQSDLYDFCCSKHKTVFDDGHCLYTECVQPKSGGGNGANSRTPVIQRNHFCSEEHRFMAKQAKTGYLIWLEESSREFKDVKGRFVKKWCKKKGKCPTDLTILAVVNPAVQDAFTAYRQTLPRGNTGTEMYFHGTRLNCDQLRDYHTLCSERGCGICGIARNGFLSKHISDRFQRFGRAFYLAPNSSKSNDYCSNPYNVQYRAMFLCEVAPGNKYCLRHNMTSLQKPPDGCHSVYGKSKFLFLKGDLNYDEIVIFNSEAICPRYILLYS